MDNRYSIIKHCFLSNERTAGRLLLRAGVPLIYGDKKNGDQHVASIGYKILQVFVMVLYDSKSID